MKALVAVTGRHGSTYEIAEAIARELEWCGIEADLRGADEMNSLDGYNAVVLGSAVFMGNWLPAARHLVERERERLAELPVWFFSSGPIRANEPKLHGEPEGVKNLVEAVQPRDYRVFVGKLDKQALGLSERLMARAVQAPDGDFRDWHAVRAWARPLAAELADLPEPVA